MLEITGLQASYGAVAAVREATFVVSRGEVLAIIGPNGAGKTTLTRSIAGLHKRRSGQIRLDGVDLSDANAVTISRAGLTLVPQGRRLFANCTVAEHIMLAGIHSRVGAMPLEDLLELFPRLRERWHVRAKSLSGGEQQMLAIIRAVILGPSVVVLDEPTEGLAPSVVTIVGELVSRLRAQGVATLLMEQHGGFPFTVADRVLRIERGVLHTEAESPTTAHGKHLGASETKAPGQTDQSSQRDEKGPA